MRSIKWCCWPWVTSNSQTTPISTFCVAFQIFVVREHGNFKFSVQVCHNNSQHMDDKLSLKRRGNVVWPILNFSPFKISLEQFKLETSNFVCLLAMWTISLWIDKQSHIATLLSSPVTFCHTPSDSLPFQAWYISWMTLFNLLSLFTFATSLVYKDEYISGN